MLYEFHSSQNKNKPGTLHATYLITGKQTITIGQEDQSNGTQSQDGQDVVMPSSPMPSSPANRHSQHQNSDTREYIATSVILVDQDHLESQLFRLTHFLLTVH